MAPPLDVRAALAAELKRLVRDAAEWPMRDRRRFRNLLLDAATSDALPIAELLLRAHDDGMLRDMPDRAAGRAAWDSAASRLVSDLQVQRFVEPGVARFVAACWVNALGADPVPGPRVLPVRPVITPRPPLRASTSAPPRPAAPLTTSNAASMRAYRRANILTLSVAMVFTVLVVLAFRSTNRPAPVAPRTATQLPEPAPQPHVAQPLERSVQPAASDSVAVGIRSDTALLAPPFGDTAVAARASVAVAAAPARTTDDIVLNAGRVFEGRVLSIRQQSVLVKDDETGLDFEIAKSDIDRIVTREGRVMRFGDDNIPSLGDDDGLAPISNAGTFRLRYAERWGAERGECREMARRFAPGNMLVVRHLRGAPMMKLEFGNGPGFSAAVRTDGLFESGAAIAPLRGPLNTFVSSRISGRLDRRGALKGVARLSAVTAEGNVVCDVALTVVGERIP